MLKMATRNPMRTNVGHEGNTEFQMHRTQHPMFDQVKEKLLDFTEHKLQRFIDVTSDPQQKHALIDLLQQYRRGNVAVAWRHGRPIYLNVTKEK